MAASAVLCSFALLSGCSDDDVCKVKLRKECNLLELSVG